MTDSDAAPAGAVGDRETGHGRGAIVLAARGAVAVRGVDSPLADRLGRQRDALDAAQHRRKLDVSVAAALLGGDPSLEAALLEVAAGGAERIVVVSMMPQRSSAVVREIGDAVNRALADIRPGRPRPDVRIVDDWHLEPRLLAAFASATYEALDAVWSANSSWRPNVDWALGSKMDAPVVFVAPQIPGTSDDPYPRLVGETAATVAGSLGLATWSHAYLAMQGRPGWADAREADAREAAAREALPYAAGALPDAAESLPGPTLETRLRELADRAERDVVVCPVGSVADDAGLLYEVDVAGQAIAESLGIRLERARSLNDDPMLIAALADVAVRALTSGD